MILKQFYLDSSGHASYLVGAEEAGKRSYWIRNATWADTLPKHKVGSWESVTWPTPISTTITWVVSANLRRALRLSSFGARAELGYSTRRLNDGEWFEIGEVLFEVFHTPGHTTEHIGFLLTDRSRGTEACVFLSGGSLLVGDVARPDLLGNREETQQNAEQLCRTLQEKFSSCRIMSKSIPLTYRAPLRRFDRQPAFYHGGSWAQDE